MTPDQKSPTLHRIFASDISLWSGMKYDSIRLNAPSFSRDHLLGTRDHLKDHLKDHLLGTSALPFLLLTTMTPMTHAHVLGALQPARCQP